jgi:nucleoside-diphosphate-sugar epimerase
MKSSDMKILVTGASGFVGMALIRNLCEKDCFEIIAALYQQTPVLPGDVGVVRITGLSSATNWSTVLAEVGTVVHLAARVHIMNDVSMNPLDEFRNINVAGTLNLARQAAEAGVKRFVFLSSIKVNGESTHKGRPFRENDKPAPQDPYGISKYEAEDGLRRLAEETGMEVVIIRPPLVYGPGVKANFQNMIRWVGRGIPLPLGAVDNKRSFIALDNLVDFIVTCVVQPKAANQIFLVSDGEDLSTPELLQRIASALGKPIRLVPVPTSLLRLAAGLLGKKAIAQRLCGSLQVDISKAQDLLDWTPPLSVDEGLRQLRN